MEVARLKALTQVAKFYFLDKIWQKWGGPVKGIDTLLLSAHPYQRQSGRNEESPSKGINTINLCLANQTKNHYRIKQKIQQ